MQVAMSCAPSLQSAAAVPWAPEIVRPATMAAARASNAWADWPESQRASSQQPLERPSEGQVAEAPMWGPTELAWEGLLHAAIGNSQAPFGPGAALTGRTPILTCPRTAWLVTSGGCGAKVHACRSPFCHERSADRTWLLTIYLL